MNHNDAKEFFKILETISSRAKTGLAFPNHPYDVLRYEDILSALNHMYELLEKDDGLKGIVSILKDAKVDIGSQEYVTPKVAVATAVYNQNDEVLLIKRIDGVWALPGGYADIPFDPIENAKKEVKEETGLEITILSLIGIYDSNINKFPNIGRQVYLLLFLAKLVGGILEPNSIETRGATFFSRQTLPNLLPITLSQIQYGYRMYKGERLPPIIEHNPDN